MRTWLTIQLIVLIVLMCLTAVCVVVHIVNRDGFGLVCCYIGFRETLMPWLDWLDKKHRAEVLSKCQF